MKLSAKLVTALTAFALLAVGLSTLPSSVSHASHGTTHTDGVVHLTNKWSNLTTEAGPPTGRVHVGSGNTLYTTFVEVTNDGSGAIDTTDGEIATDANVLIIDVVDADKDVPIDASRTDAGGNAVVWGGGDVAGGSQIVPLTLAESPVVNPTGVVVRAYDAGDVEIVGAVTLANVVAGSDTQAGSITLVRTGTAPGSTVAYVELEWQTSAISTLDVTVKTTQNQTGITVTLTETGAATGRFRGEVTLVDVDSLAPDGPNALGATEIEAENGAVVTVDYEDDTPVSGTTRTASRTATAETSAPAVNVVGPAHEMATQLRRPEFSGSVTDSGSGLTIDEILVWIDETGSTTVPSVAPTSWAGSGDDNLPALPSGASDGTTSTTFTFTPGSDLPSGGIASPDHWVIWQVSATDRAGNVGWSDSDSDTDNVAGQGQMNLVKIDRTLPGIDAAWTGFWIDMSSGDPVRKLNNARSIEVMFNDNIDPDSIAESDFQVQVGGVNIVPVSASVGSGEDQGGNSLTDRVLLMLDADLASNSTPTVRVVGQISDAAGNTTSTGSTVAADALAPVLTVDLSGGTATADPSGRTKGDMVISVTSDEALSANPTVEIWDEDDTVTRQGTVTAIGQGSNQWLATFKGSNSAFTGGDASNPDGKKKSVRVIAADAATTTAPAGTALPAGSTVGERVFGQSDASASGATTFVLDKFAPVLSLMPDGTTSDSNPFLRLAFGGLSGSTFTTEQVVLNEILFGPEGEDGMDITSGMGTSDNKTFIYAASNLELGDYEVGADVTDLAGNQSATLGDTFEVVERSALTTTLFPGTTLFSVPLPPSNPDVNAVFGDAVVSVTSYNPATGMMSSSVRDEASGLLAGDVTSIVAGRGYIVVVDAVAEISIDIPALSPGSVPPQIPLGGGWNLVGAVDVTGNADGSLRSFGAAIEGRDVYFPEVVTQVYTWDTIAQAWTRVVSGETINVGSAYWAFATETSVIVP